MVEEGAGVVARRLTVLYGTVERLLSVDYVHLHDVDWDEHPRLVGRFGVVGEDEPQREVREVVYIGRGAIVPLRTEGVPRVLPYRLDPEVLPLPRDAWAEALADATDGLVGRETQVVALLEGSVVVIAAGDDDDRPAEVACAIAEQLDALRLDPAAPSTVPPPTPFVLPRRWGTEAHWRPAPAGLSLTEGAAALVVHFRGELSADGSRHLVVTVPSSFDPEVRRRYSLGRLRPFFDDEDLVVRRLVAMMGESGKSVEELELRDGLVVVMGHDDPSGHRDAEVVAAAGAVSGAAPALAVSPGLERTRDAARRWGHPERAFREPRFPAAQWGMHRRSAGDARVEHTADTTWIDHRRSFLGHAMTAAWMNRAVPGPVGRVRGRGTHDSLEIDPGTDPELVERVTRSLRERAMPGPFELVATPDLVWAVVEAVGRGPRHGPTLGTVPELLRTLVGHAAADPVVRSPRGA
ncbi:hypothetical protein [Rhabdothermincola salaria]|uniref:hypothetical protein n=1 Tax=Rhabdothermincola salaria TaxID=2903142 RepID=UPI001E42A201|nr:hypothetical protein [Rhabdothermincola salaria]MCD9624873.1 hypothetical protein [Rhabdothermincola salaria]